MVSVYIKRKEADFCFDSNVWRWIVDWNFTLHDFWAEFLVPYIHCKPRLITFFKHFVRLMINVNFQSRAAYNFYLFTISKGIDNAQSFFGNVLSTKLSSHSILFNITCTSFTEGSMNRRQL